VSEYDCISETLFDLHFPAIAYIDKYVRDVDFIGEDKFTQMYSAMRKHKDLLAVVLANNAYLIKVFPKRVVAENFEGTETTVLSAYHDYSSYADDEIIPVGFERTVCRTIEVLIPPGRIFYNPTTDKVFYKNNWVSLPLQKKPVKFTGKSLYHKLMQVGGEGIIYVGEDTPVIINKKV
jgi:hypothetical protein